MRVDELFFLEKYNLEAKVKNSPEHIWVDPHPCLVFLVFDPFSFTSIIVKSRWFSSVQLLSGVRLFATPWITTRQDSLPSPTPGSLLKLMSIELVMPSSHPIFCHPLLLLPPVPPSIRSFPVSQLFTWGGQSIGVSASVSVFQMNTQDWSPLGWTGWISLQSKGLSRVFSNTTVQKYQFFSAQISSQPNSHIHRWPLEKP